MPRTNDLRLSEHWNLREFEEPATHLVMLHPVLLYALEELRLDYGCPIRVTSGYRSARHNADVGGVPRSLHLRGAAADLVVDPHRMDRLERLAKELPQLLVIRETDHLHVEVASTYL